jgi:hypothetical protein
MRCSAGGAGIFEILHNDKVITTIRHYNHLLLQPSAITTIRHYYHLTIAIIRHHDHLSSLSSTVIMIITIIPLSLSLVKVVMAVMVDCSLASGCDDYLDNHDYHFDDRHRDHHNYNNHHNRAEVFRCHS